MIKNNTIVTPLIIIDQVSEATHWAIQFGEILLPSTEGHLIEDCNINMNMLLRLLFRIYVRSLVSSDHDLSARINAFIPRLMDPYLPGICAEAGIDNSADEYLDEIDQL